ncbi:TPA: hypothetical protein ACPZFV_003775 [Yersinia enterocolitica]
MSEIKQYDTEVRLEAVMGTNHYGVHIHAMTAENLHSKSDIAVELAWRDLRIEQLIAQLEAAQKERDALKMKLSDAGCLLVEWKQRVEKAENEHDLLAVQLEIATERSGINFDRAQKAEAALSAANERTLAPVILEIANERLRQISVEGWTPEHDDQHSSGELAGAAGYYAKHVNARQWCFKNNPDDYQCEPEPSGWPWAAEWWKPKNPRSDLIRAAALIVAELERLDRAAGFTVEE